MSLTEYNKKRDFHKTAEPKGKQLSRTGHLFVVQKHAASHLHYDFRLEFDGVLKSWAVPKGPSLDPAIKALAMQVEDHPVDYGDFEGIIPAGEYGGGTVMVWDHGTWEAVEDPREGFRRGSLKFELRGKKLKGSWALVRMRVEKGRAQWLLIKHKDKYAQPGDGHGLTERATKSVLTGRTLEQIAVQKKRVWVRNGEEPVARSSPRNSSTKTRKPVPRKKKPTTSGTVKRTTKTRATSRTKRKPRTTAKRKAEDGSSPASMPAGSIRGAMPENFTPQLATLEALPPAGDDWLHELKFDGYRLLAVGGGRRVRLLTRNGNDWTEKFSHVADLLTKEEFRGVIDGEIVALDDRGVSDFQSLQNALRDQRQDQSIFFAFDLPFFDGYDLRSVPLETRKHKLKSVIEHFSSATRKVVRLSEHVVGEGDAFFRAACKRGLEGIVSKRRDAPYVSLRSPSWLKVKCSGRQEFVVGGFTEPGRARIGFGALLLGYFDPNGLLRYCGKVGTGFDSAQLAELRKRLERLVTAQCPYTAPPKEAFRDVPTWVEPKLVAEIEFTEWTADGALRHPSFQGLREDKEAREVVREQTIREKLRNRPAASGGPRVTKRSSVNAAKDSKSEARIAGVRLTHPDRILFPDVGVTKLDLAAYYESVADWILPYVVGRPLTLVRCPEGASGECFYQKNWKDNLPDEIKSVLVSAVKKNERYVTIDGLEGLISLVQIGTLEMHPWGSRNDKLEHPDQMIFDLDPDPDVPWSTVRRGAEQIRDLLAELNLDAFVRTSGGKGVHVVVPLARRNSWDEVKEFSHDISYGLALHEPERYVAKMTKNLRKGKIFIDYLRNQRGATSVASYSTRSRPTASVALPIGWDELSRIHGPADFTVANVPNRLRRLKHDPWKSFFTTRQTLTSAIRKAAAAFAR